MGTRDERELRRERGECSERRIWGVYGDRLKHKVYLYENVLE